MRLAWLPGETGHLLDAVTLLPELAAELFPWLGRAPVAAQAAALRDLLLGERFRFAAQTLEVYETSRVLHDDWRLLALDHTLAQLRAGKSPAPFTLADPDFNRDLLAALVALDPTRGNTLSRLQRPCDQRHQRGPQVAVKSGSARVKGAGDLPARS